MLSAVFHHHSILAIYYDDLPLIVRYVSFPMPLVYFKTCNLRTLDFFFEKVRVERLQSPTHDIIHTNLVLFYYENVEEVVVQLHGYWVVTVILCSDVVLVGLEGVKLEKSTPESPEDVVREDNYSFSVRLL